MHIAWGRFPVIAVGVAGFVLVAATGCSSQDAEATGSATDSAASAAAAFQAGDCVRFVDSGGPEGASVNKVSCDENHHGEVVLASADFFSTDEQLPAEDRLPEIAEAACKQGMDTYAGALAETMTFQMSYTYPTESSWAAGDRKLTCIAVAMDPQQGTATEIIGSIQQTG